MQRIDNPPGNYRFAAGIAPYSAGVIAMPGYEIVHATLRQPRPYRQGFARIEEHLTACRRPRAALCGVELRAPAPFTFEGFITFNDEYRLLLDAWNLLWEGHNPIARTNIAPVVRPPDEPALYGFSYTAPLTESEGDATPTFIIAGAGDLRDQADLTPAAIVRPGETSADALREKAECVLDVMQERLDGVGADWSAVTTVNVYTAQPLHPLLAEPLLARMQESAVHGVHWHYSHPPIQGLAFEMDLRGVRREIWLDV